MFDEATALGRRNALKAVAAGGLAFALPAAAPAATRREVEHYYAFLWAELAALSKELGVPFGDAVTAQRSGGVAAYDAAFAKMPPSRRALAVMEAARKAR